MDIQSFLKKYSNVDNKFVNDFFSLYKADTNSTDHVIDLDVVAKYLYCQKQHLIQTLKDSYVENIDYKILGNKVVKAVGRSKKYILLTPDCFKLLCMQSRSKNAHQVRLYFLEVEKTLFAYKNEINEAMTQRIQAVENNLKPITNVPKQGVIYVIKASDTMDSVYKIGRTKNLKQRLANYMSDKADNSQLEVVYVYKTDNVNAVEACLKTVLKQVQYRKYKEVYQINIDILKDIINKRCGIAVDKVADASPRMQLHYQKKGALSVKKGGSGSLYAAIFHE